MKDHKICLAVCTYLLSGQGSLASPCTNGGPLPTHLVYKLLRGHESILLVALNSISHCWFLIKSVAFSLGIASASHHVQV